MSIDPVDRPYAWGRPALPSRRGFLTVAAAGLLTPLATLLARRAEATDPSREPAQSLIVLWLAGGPSQLETFDPHPGRRISAETRAIETNVSGVKFAAGLPKLAQHMSSLAVIRSLKSKEGDHERGTYLVRTGYRPDPTAVHPAIGAICCHELPAAGTDIPRHIAILPGEWPARGGYLGDQYDAFQTGDPAGKIADVAPQVSFPRYEQRLKDLEMLERVFARGRRTASDVTMHAHQVREARQMMTSAQLEAFHIGQEPAELLAAYGDTPFGRGCLAARRLIEVGVRCVEVTLSGWDSHANNHEVHQRLNATLDPAFATLIEDLKRRGTWERTVILCGGEFGRTPRINPLGGRDHWPHGFSMALAGGPIRGGLVVGATDPQGSKAVEQPRQIGDIHATILTALGINPAKELISPAGRPLKLAEGTPVGEVLA